MKVYLKITCVLLFCYAIAGQVTGLLYQEDAEGLIYNKGTKRETEKEMNTRLVKQVASLQSANQILQKQVESLKKDLINLNTPTDCLEVLNNDPSARSGLHQINIGRRDSPKLITVYCDMDTDGGGWTVIQRRVDGTINFYRNYEDYAKGFGLNLHEFWIGNEKLHLLTSSVNELRVDIEDVNENTIFAKYSTFSVDSACNGFMLHVDGYSGTAGDSLTLHNGMKFTTLDRDQDILTTDNCAIRHTGAWWYHSCYQSNLNGLYLPPGTSDIRAVIWNSWSARSLKFSEMKIRPAFPVCPL